MITLQDIVSSRLSVCSHTQHHISPGVVSYDNTLQSNTKDIRILGETIKVRRLDCFYPNFVFSVGGCL